MAKRVRLDDIAAACGVTKGLVSRALTGKYNVSDETRSRIMQKAAEMGYDSNHLRSRPESVTRVLIVISTRMMLKEDYWQPILKAISKTLDMSSVVLEYFVYEENHLDEVTLEKLEMANCSAYVIIHSNPEVINSRLKNLNKPIIEVDPKYFDTDGLTKIKFSNYDSTFKATQGLVDYGHKVIGFYGADSHSTSFRERHEGFLSCIDSNKGTLGVSINFDNADGAFADDAMLEKALRAKPITALVCANDLCALNAYRVIKRLGKKVPDDISVIGFDNIKEGIISDPPLTTINVPREDLGRDIANYLIGMFGEKQLRYSQVAIHCPLVLRQSVKNLHQGEK